MRRGLRSSLILGAAALAVGLVPAEAAAQGIDVTPFVGFLSGGSIEPDAIPRSVENGLTWGVRVGIFPGEQSIVGIEGSFTQSSAADFDLAGAAIDSRATYGEANVVIQAPLARAMPYVTAGVGVHSFRVTDIDAPTHRKIGYNFGGGVKIELWSQPRGRWGIRFDVRDHVSPLKTDGMRPGFRDKLQLPDPSDTSLHNVVSTIGLYFSF